MFGAVLCLKLYEDKINNVQTHVHKITWTSNDHRTQTQIDHIAIGLRWRTPCLQDVHVYQGADVYIDCYLAIEKFKVKLKGQKKKEEMSTPTTQAQFQRFLSSRFSALADWMPGPSEWWDTLKDAMSTAREEISERVLDQLLYMGADRREKRNPLEKTQLHFLKIFHSVVLLLIQLFFSLQQNLSRLFRQAFIHCCELHQVWE